MTVADCLTVLRLVLVPFFLGAFLLGKFFTAFILFTIAGVTDLVDGSIARLLKQPSRLGAFLDPIADKALMVTTVTCLLLAEIIPFWFFLLVVVRDLTILGGLTWLRLKKIDFELKPVTASKFGTLSNIILVVFAFLSFLKPAAVFLGLTLALWMNIFLAISTALIVISAVQYGITGLQILKNRHGQTAH